MQKWLLAFLLFPLLTTAQLKEIEVSEMERPDVAVVQANAQWPDDALLLVYSSIDGLQFRSSMGAVDKQTYNNTAGRYEILVKPVKQMMFVAKSGFMELKIATINPNPKDDFYYRVEEKKQEVVKTQTSPNLINGQQSFPKLNNDDGYLDSFDKNSSNVYTMFKEDRAGMFGNPRKMRRRIIEKAKTFAEQNNYELEVVSQDIHPMGVWGNFASFTYTFRLISKSGETNVNAPVQIISSREKAISELKGLKELLDLGIISQEEYETKTNPLKKIVLDN